MAVDSNDGEESSAPTPNSNQSQPVGLIGIGKSPVCQKDTIHQNDIKVGVSSSFAVLSPAENDSEPLDTTVGNTHMDVEEKVPVTTHTACQDSMDVEILRNTSQQILNHEPTRKDHSSSNTTPSRANDTQDSDGDSLGSDWDHGAHRYSTMSFAALDKVRRKEPTALLHRRRYQREPQRESQLPFPFCSRNPAATSSIRP